MNYVATKDKPGRLQYNRSLFAKNGGWPTILVGKTVTRFKGQTRIRTVRTTQSTQDLYGQAASRIETAGDFNLQQIDLLN